MTSLSNEGPLYHVGQKFTSARMTRREKLNIEVMTTQPTPVPVSVINGYAERAA